MKKRVLFVINTLGRAGAETALVALLKRLDCAVLDIDLYVCLGQGELIDEIPDYVHVLNREYDGSSVLTSDGKKKLKMRVVKMLLSKGIIFKNLPYIIGNVFNNLSQHRKISVEKLLWRGVADAGKGSVRGHYDLAVAYIEGASAYFVDRYVNADKKAGFIHVDYGMAGYSRKLDNCCFDRFDRVFTVSDEVRESFLNIYPECEALTQVFHNLIDVDAVKLKSKAFEPKELENSKDKLKLLTVCRLTAQKSLEVSVEAMKILRDGGLNAVWYVVGDGEEREKLTGLIRKYGLEDCFILLGTRDNPYPYFANADIYVHATKFEGKSIAIQEAQILELPVIASDCSGNREQVENGVDGCLCQFDARHIADAVLNMNDNRDKWSEFTEKASRRISENAEELDKIYNLLGL
jgi:glycosyltransferase involved in cell wall biosynthesis